jgi:hypothetical protein
MKIISALVLLLTLAMPVFSQETQSQQNLLDYCGRQISFDLPQGWTAGDVYSSNTGTSKRIANNPEALTKNSIDLNVGEAQIIVGVFNREQITTLLKIDTNSDVNTMIRAVAVMTPPVQNFTFGDVRLLTIQGVPAAQINAYSATTLQEAIFIDFNADMIGLLLLSIPVNDQTHWDSTLIEVENSFTFDVSRFPQLPNSLPLTQPFALPDCSIAFAYPDGWKAIQLSANGAPVFNVWIMSYDVPGRPLGKLPEAGQARLQLQAIPPGFLRIDSRSSIDQFSRQAGYKVISRSSALNDRATMVEVQISSGGKYVGDALQIEIVNDDWSITRLSLFCAPNELDRWRATALTVAESLQVNLANA